MIRYRYLGYGITNNGGVAKLDHDATGNPIQHSYTGSGVGELDIVASLDNPISKGSLVSETYELLDYIFYDKGILSDNHDWYDNNLPPTIFERLEDCTYLKYSQSKNRIQITPIITYDSFVFEFKSYSTPTTIDDYVIFQFSDKQTVIPFSYMQGDYNVKFEVNRDKMSLFVDGVAKLTNYQLQYDVSNGVNLRFGLNSNSDGIKVSDIKVYHV